MQAWIRSRNQCAGISTLEAAFVLVFLTVLSLLVLGLGIALMRSYSVQYAVENMLQTYDTDPLRVLPQQGKTEVAEDKLNKMLERMLNGPLAKDISSAKRYFMEARWQAFALDPSSGGQVSSEPVAQGVLQRANFSPDANLLNETDLNAIIKKIAFDPVSLALYRRPSGMNNEANPNEQFLPYVVVMAARAAVGLEDELSASVWRQGAGSDAVSGLHAIALRSDY